MFHPRHARHMPSGHCQRTGETGGRKLARLIFLSRPSGRPSGDFWLRPFRFLEPHPGICARLAAPSSARPAHTAPSGGGEPLDGASPGSEVRWPAAGGAGPSPHRDVSRHVPGGKDEAHYAAGRKLWDMFGAGVGCEERCTALPGAPFSPCGRGWAPPSPLVGEGMAGAGALQIEWARKNSSTRCLKERSPTASM